MEIRQTMMRSLNDLPAAISELSGAAPQLILCFASLGCGALAHIAKALRQALPNVSVAGCSTAGEISVAGVSDQSVVLTALRFASGTPLLVSTRFSGADDSQAAGARLGRQLANQPQSAVLLFAQGVNINGSALVSGLAAELPPGSRIVGGLAGDDGAFQATQVMANDEAGGDLIVAVAIPAGVTIGHGSFGGWKPFGPARKVTRAKANVLYELDGESALSIYKRYLGEHAKGLPASGLLFPFEMLDADHSSVGLIRTILGVDETSGSLTLAGNIAPDGYLRLMHASNDALIEGAEAAAEAASGMMGDASSKFCLLISCIGRKLVMGKRIDDEIEAVGAVFGQGAVLAGFYSYGEISPFLKTAECKLHNQTMTITSFAEAG